MACAKAVRSKSCAGGFSDLPRMIRFRDCYPRANVSKWIGQHVVAYVVRCSTSPFQVYAQLEIDEAMKAFLETQAFVRSHCTNTAVPFTGTIGVPCLAKHSGDGTWYRARIKRNLGNGVYEVVFVDYGDKDEITDNYIMSCPFKLLQFAESACECSFIGFTGQESEKELNNLKLLIKGHHLVFKIVTVECRDDGEYRILVDAFDTSGIPLKQRLDQLIREQDSEFAAFTHESSTGTMPRKYSSDVAAGCGNGNFQLSMSVGAGKMSTEQSPPGVAQLQSELREKENSWVSIKTMLKAEACYWINESAKKKQSVIDQLTHQVHSLTLQLTLFKSKIENKDKELRRKEGSLDALKRLLGKENKCVELEIAKLRLDLEEKTREEQDLLERLKSFKMDTAKKIEELKDIILQKDSDFYDKQIKLKNLSARAASLLIKLVEIRCGKSYLPQEIRRP